jgi:hypothetical protein
VSLTCLQTHHYCAIIEPEEKMENHRYNVILSYDPNDLEIHRNVIACLFDLDPKAARRFKNAKFTGRMIIKRGADLMTAKRFGHLFRHTGATSSFQKIVSQPAPLDGNSAPAHGSQASHRTPNMMAPCPNCGHQQLQVEECEVCGIIIAKAKTRPAPAQTAAPVAQTHPSNPWAMLRMLKGAERIRRPFGALLQKIQHPLAVDKLSGWAQQVADRLIRCGLVLVIALILEVGLLVFYKMTWLLYIATTTGQYYIKTFPEKAAVLERIAHADPLSLGLDTTLTVLWIGLLVGAVAQLLHLIGHLYESQHFIGKLVIWFAPSIGAAAWVMTQQEPFPEMTHAAILVALPALCMLSSCLYLAQAILPGVGELLKRITAAFRNRSDAWGRIIKKIRK